MGWLLTQVLLYYSYRTMGWLLTQDLLYLLQDYGLVNNTGYVVLVTGLWVGYSLHLSEIGYEFDSSTALSHSSLLMPSI